MEPGWKLGNTQFAEAAGNGYGLPISIVEAGLEPGVVFLAWIILIVPVRNEVAVLRRALGLETRQFIQRGVKILE